MSKKKIVFMGTPKFAVPILQMLIENYGVDLVITQPDKKVGRKKILTPPPVKEVAVAHDIRWRYIKWIKAIKPWYYYYSGLWTVSSWKYLRDSKV